MKKKMMVVMTVLAAMLAVTSVHADLAGDIAFYRAIPSVGDKIDGFVGGMTNAPVQLAEYRTALASSIQTYLVDKGQLAADKVDEYLTGTLTEADVEPYEAYLLTRNWSPFGPIKVGNLDHYSIGQIGTYDAVGRMSPAFKTQMWLAVYETAYNQTHLNAALRACQAQVRRTMRDNGESIVAYRVTEEVDGKNVNRTVNPIEVRMQALMAAANEPMLQGIEAELAAFGITVAPINRSAELQAEIVALQESAWYGDIGVNQVSARLKFLLGTTAYNAWVASYNGE
jgi:hypothetical protein